MKVPRSAVVGQSGVHAVAQRVAQMGWLFREQPVHDFGIDAIVELVEDDRATGKLLAFQIKSGKSAVAERLADTIIFRGDRDHLTYWLSHSLPVIVVVYDDEADVAYWEHVTEAAAKPTGRGWKLPISLSHNLDERSCEALAQIAAGDPYVLRLRQLRLNKPWMELVAQGSRIFIEADEWINKTSGRGDLRIVVEDDAGKESVDATWTILVGFRPYEAVLPALFPWATLEIDEWLYEDADRAQFELEEGMWDSEDGVMITFSDFRGWRERRYIDTLRPYEDDGEVARWRLEATLNDLGTAFLQVDGYLAHG